MTTAADLLYLRETEHSRIPIKSDNVICACPRCGSEHSVDLYAHYKNGEHYLGEASLLCEKCLAEKMV